MWWRGTLSGGLRARLKGPRSSLRRWGRIWPTKVGVRTSGPCESCSVSTDLWVLVQARSPYCRPSQWANQPLHLVFSVVIRTMSVPMSGKKSRAEFGSLKRWSPDFYLLMFHKALNKLYVPLVSQFFSFMIKECGQYECRCHLCYGHLVWSTNTSVPP